MQISFCWPDLTAECPGCPLGYVSMLGTLIDTQTMNALFVTLKSAELNPVSFVSCGMFDPCFNNPRGVWRFLSPVGNWSSVLESVLSEDRYDVAFAGLGSVSQATEGLRRSQLSLVGRQLGLLTLFL